MLVASFRMLKAGNVMLAANYSMLGSRFKMLDAKIFGKKPVNGLFLLF
jgi:hypothetical protein